MKRRHLEPVVQRRAHYRVDLALEHDDVSHHHGVITGARKSSPAGKAQVGNHSRARNGRLDVFAREVDLEHTFLLVQRTLEARQLLDACRVQGSGLRQGGGNNPERRTHQCGDSKEMYRFHVPYLKSTAGIADWLMGARYQSSRP